VVTLRGRVASGEISDRAQAIATSTSGVKGVKNKLKIPQS
jgi:osmotically-inducible protein OsmY